jgi:hypothetical protein
VRGEVINNADSEDKSFLVDFDRKNYDRNSDSDDDHSPRYMISDDLETQDTRKRWELDAQRGNPICFSFQLTFKKWKMKMLAETEFELQYN